MAMFGILYFVLIVYAIILRLSVRSNLKAGLPTGLIYKIQVITILVISGGTAVSLAILFSKSIIDALFQFVPTILISLIVLVRSKQIGKL
ncbi:MAG: hypothetical protein COA86_17455 [Kangiella sp.]|nr:MAG: hypothetical protein COA86_17455 [Kangiella sp.]